MPKADWSRTSTSTGYVVVYCPDHPRAWTTGYVYAHRMVVEESLGRVLGDDEFVHHKDHNKKKNDLSNLEVLSAADHQREHAKLRPARFNERTCPQCGSFFRRRIGLSAITCSARCRGLRSAELRGATRRS